MSHIFSTPYTTIFEGGERQNTFLSAEYACENVRVSYI